jgi:hypothetical protein
MASHAVSVRPTNVADSTCRGRRAGRHCRRPGLRRTHDGDDAAHDGHDRLAVGCSESWLGVHLVFSAIIGAVVGDRAAGWPPVIGLGAELYSLPWQGRAVLEDLLSDRADDTSDAGA